MDLSVIIQTLKSETDYKINVINNQLPYATHNKYAPNEKTDQKPKSLIANQTKTEIPH